MNNWLNIIQKKLLPPRCILCGDSGFDDLDLCAACHADLPRNTHCCYRCAENLDTGSQAPQLCGRCTSKSPDFDDTYAPFLYRDGIRYMITQLKFARQFKNARLLGTLMARHLMESAELPECIIPMPVHVNRYRRRGFNQSIEIARHLSARLGIPIAFDHCFRNRDTAPQTSLSAKMRLNNPRHAFSMKKPLPFQHIAVVDDVMTTGATVSALALLLKQNGASRVDAWICGRA